MSDTVNPTLRPFNVATDLDIVEDYMTGLRANAVVVTSSQEVSEHVVFDYELAGVRNLLKPEEPERVLCFVVVSTPSGKHRSPARAIAGVANGEMWLEQGDKVVSSKDDLIRQREWREQLEADGSVELMKQHIGRKREKD